MTGFTRRVQPTSAGIRGSWRLGLEPSGAFTEHITFQISLFSFPPYRLQIEVDGRQSLLQGFRPAQFLQPNVKRTSTARTSRRGS